MTESTKSALQLYGEICRSSEMSILESKFDSHSKALDEIQQLQAENYRLKLANALLTHKRGRGRPKKLIKKPLGGNLGLFGSFFSEGTAASSKQKGGRRVKYRDEEKREIIKTYDDLKKELGKPTMTDKRLLSGIADVRGMGWRKKGLVDRLCKELKYFRDETGIRQKQKKRKTPSKNSAVK